MDMIANALHGIGWAFLPLTLLPVIALATSKSHGFARSACDLVEAFNRALGSGVRWLYPALVISVVFTVFALSIFGWASTKLDESAKYLHATALMLGAGATLLADEHVRVDVFYAGMRPTTQRLVDFCGFYGLLLPLMLAILWQSQGFTRFAWQIFEGSPDADGLPGQFLLKTLIPAFAVIMIAQGTAIATRAAMALRSDSQSADGALRDG